MVYMDYAQTLFLLQLAKHLHNFEVIRYMFPHNTFET